MKKYIYFDHAATTRCSEAVVEEMKIYHTEIFGNPSSSHFYGQMASRGLFETRTAFSAQFRVKTDQVIFTGSGSESDNLGILGPCHDLMAKRFASGLTCVGIKVIISTIEHAAVKKAAHSLKAFGFTVEEVPVDQEGKVDRNVLSSLVDEQTHLVSIQHVNNILGSFQDIEDLAEIVKNKNPKTIFHTDCVQALGKLAMPTSLSKVDLVSISAHKVEGPKGIGALIVLNPKLIHQGIRPIVFGGGQEVGLRSGTQSPALIAGFRIAFDKALAEREKNLFQCRNLRSRFEAALIQNKLINDEKSPLVWNSPKKALPHIISLSVPGLPTAPFVRMIEERGCLISTGSACSSSHADHDPVLMAVTKNEAIAESAIRISFGPSNSPADIDQLVAAISESIQQMRHLLNKK